MRSSETKNTGFYFMQIFLYYTLGCHLCELAEAVITETEQQQKLRIDTIKIDIAESDELMDLYGTRIPVVKAASMNKTLDWPFDSQSLAHYLASG